MKQEYIYDEGKITAYDDEIGLCKSIEYQDNIENIFLTENTIEITEDVLPKLKNKKSNYEQNLKEMSKNIYGLLIFLIIIALFAPTLTCHLISAVGKISFSSITVANIHLAPLLTIFFCPIFTLIGLTKVFATKSDIKTLKRKINGLNTEIGFLEKKLEKEKENLNNLKNDKTRELEEEMKIKPKRKINNERVINNLKELRDLYFNIGYYEKKYTKYYDNGKLNQKLRKDYSKEEINIIEEEIKQKKLTKEYNG